MFESLLTLHHHLYHVKRDPFDEYKFDERVEKDVKMFENYTEALRNVTKICFKRCSNFNYTQFTSYEEICLKECFHNVNKSNERMLSTSHELKK